MAKTKTHEADRHTRSGGPIKHQPNRFLGLFLAPLAGLPTAWLIHVWTMGVNLHWWRLSWVVRASSAAPSVAVSLITAATIGLSVLAWHFSEHRKSVLRATLAGSVAAVGALFAINVGTGPHYWWSGLFLLAGWTVAIAWSLARLDVTRNDKGSEDGGKDEGFLEKVGLKGWRARNVKEVTDDQGRPLATEVEMQHAEGDTTDQLQRAVPAFESATASPAGLSRATATERADRSTLVVMHRDPLAEILPIVATTSPGGCITEPISIARYATGALEQAYLAGGEGFSPSSYLKMGMNRTGKTQGENIMFTEVISRRNAVIMYLNQAKGMQDVRPVIPGIEVAIIADEGDTKGLYRKAIKKVRSIIGYRQRQLAVFGIHEWNAEQCWNNPPWRTDENGRRVQMERMPFLVVHVGEADSILANDNGDAIFIVSKGLSVGICTGWSLQRADYVSMPTGLRYNLGTVWCYGIGDDISAGFALSEPTIKAGAHPEYWKQSRQGYHFFEGVNIDETLYPVPARTFGKGENGEKLRDTLLRRNLYWGPRMARLDSGSVNATADGPGEKPWWTEMAEQTDGIRKTLLAGGAPATASIPQAYTGTNVGAETETDEIDEELREMLDDELRAIAEEAGEDPDGWKDAYKPLADPVAPEDDITWADPRPPARNREAAIEALKTAFGELLADPSLRDPADPTGRTVIITASMIAERYPFRSRPFFVEVLGGMADGTIDLGANRSITRAPDLGATAGKYRLTDHSQ